MIVYFVRHGESVANTSRVISNRSLPHPLTANGRAQALQLAARMQPVGITAIYASPVPRALETARLVGETLLISPHLSEGLREFDAGELEGRSDQLAWMRFSSLWNHWFYRGHRDKRIKGGESYNEAAQRFSGFAAQLTALHADAQARVLCVTHGGLLRVGFSGLLENIDFVQARDYPIDYTTVITTVYTDGNWLCADWDGANPPAGR